MNYSAGVSSQQCNCWNLSWIDRKKMFHLYTKSFFHVNYFLYVYSTGCLKHSRAVRFFKSPTDFRFYLRKKKEECHFEICLACGSTKAADYLGNSCSKFYVLKNRKNLNFWHFSPKFWQRAREYNYEIYKMENILPFWRLLRADYVYG